MDAVEEQERRNVISKELAVFYENARINRMSARIDSPRGTSAGTKENNQAANY